MRNVFAGTGVALVTPFSEDLMVDYQGLERLLAYNTDNGVDYFVVMGTTAEAATINKEEKQKILSFIKDNNPKKLPIVYGIGGNNTTGVMDEIKGTDFEGVEALLSACPYYNKPSQSGIIKHYEAIADACPVPVILYNVPGRTAVNMTAKTTLKLAQHPNIVGIKEASGDLMQCIEISWKSPDDFVLISGDDMLTVPIISIGGIGVISVMANAFPHLFTKMTHGALKGKQQEFLNPLFSLSAINALMYKEGNPTGIKQVLSEMGICEKWVRPPMDIASATLKAEIVNKLEEIELLNPIF